MVCHSAIRTHEKRQLVRDLLDAYQRYCADEIIRCVVKDRRSIICMLGGIEPVCIVCGLVLGKDSYLLVDCRAS